VQHRIHLNDDATPKRDPQRRLNPFMQDVVRTEILKLLDNVIIYSISIVNGLVMSMLFSKKLALQ